MLTAIQNLPRLSHLDLEKNLYKEDDLALLSASKSLRWLNLRITRFGNTGLKHLKKIKTLEYLNLDGTEITDEAVADLKEMAELKRLVVGPYLSNASITVLQKVLPKCTILRQEE